MKKTDEKKTPLFRLYLMNIGQCDAIKELFFNQSAVNVDRIYLNSDLFYLYPGKMNRFCESMKSKFPEIEIWMGMPSVLRDKDDAYLGQMGEMLKESPFLCGALCGNLEGVGFFLERFPKCRLLADHSFYFWNREAWRLWDGKLQGACLPLELNGKEQNALLTACGFPKRQDHNDILQEKNELAWDKIVFYRIPFMQTANCIAKTNDSCMKKKEMKNKDSEMQVPFTAYLKDRTGADFPVLINCIHCFNTIYNSVPMSLHGDLAKWSALAGLRLHFTMESKEETLRISNWFLFENCAPEKMPYKQFTRGHEKRGVL